jgi:glycine/D-amino acid oxidase-like deaminating enzyme
VIVGGADEPGVGRRIQNGLLNAKSRELTSALSRLRPGLNIEPAFVWSGVFAQTPDGLPFIGAHPRWPHAHFALGYGGNGITFSVLAAQFNRDRILGRTNADAGIFGFDRITADSRA